MRANSIEQIIAMLRRVWTHLFGSRSTPARLARDAEASGDVVAPTGFEQMSSTELMELCDEFWRSLSETALDYPRYVGAENELARRGREILPWAQKRLRHEEYEARALAAFLMGELASRRQIAPDELPEVIAELSILALRPWQEDTKEAEANDAAIGALGKTRDKRAIPALRRIITSLEWDDDDNSWEAACVLGELVNEPFDQADDPVRAARQWLENRPS